MKKWQNYISIINKYHQIRTLSVQICLPSGFVTQMLLSLLSITKTHPCNIQRFFTAVKMTIFSRFFLTIFIFLLKTYIVGTR